MKKLLLLPLALLLAACGPTGGGDTKPADSGSGGPAQSDPKTTPTTPPTTAVKGNPNRVYQLDTLKKTDLDVKGTTIHAWVMDDEGKQAEGMMFLEDKDVKADEGMLFVFAEVQPKTNPDGSPRGFWMQNTLIPLDIVFMSPQGKVISIGHGKRLDETNVPAGGEFQYVLELKAGTSERLGLKVGDTLTIPKL